MITKTLYFGSDGFISAKNEQLVFKKFSDETLHSVPIEEIGIIEIDSAGISISKSVLSKLSEYGAAAIVCDSTHHPCGIYLPLYSNTLHSKRIKVQAGMTLPQKKSAWKAVVKAKILNQYYALKQTGRDVKSILDLSGRVKSGDSDNREGAAASIYWKKIFGNKKFKREREGKYPNNLLNYGYTILRTVIARAIVSSGLHPALGLFHKNQYNPFCLADDLMEPYRPFVDLMVHEIYKENGQADELTPELKARMLIIPQLDTVMSGKTRPLMVAAQKTSISFYQFIENSKGEIKCPELKD